MMILYRIILLIALFASHQSSLLPSDGFINKPVADLLLKSAQGLPYDFKKDPPYSMKGKIAPLPRCLQLLLHEKVTIISDHGNEIKINVPDAFYTTNHTSYITDKQNVTELNDQNKKHIPFETDAPTKTLLFPFGDESEITFSAGTSFVLSKPCTQSDTFCTVMVYDEKNKNFSQKLIPSDFFLHSSGNKRDDFITIVRSWKESPDGFVPYAWGGSSFAYQLDEKPIKKTYGSYVYWIYPNDKKHTIKSGFDCSGLVWRAARMAGITLPGRNTSMLGRLKRIPQDEDPQVGDLILLSGHVVIVSGNNNIIEASGYDNGVGHIREISISDRFAGIQTLQELKKECEGGKRFCIFVKLPVND